MKKRCVIVAGGDCEIASLCDIGCNDYVIAADSGLKHCDMYSIVPDLIVGDFDSYDSVIPEGIETVKLPVQKDDTDLLFAVRCALARGFDEVVIYGGYGSRPDQNMAMFQTLNWFSHNSQNAEIYAKCVGFEVYIITDGSRLFKKSTDRYLSLFAFDGAAKGVTVKGAEYELNDAVVLPSFPIGVSNVAINDTLISVNEGTLIVFLVNKNI